MSARTLLRTCVCGSAVTERRELFNLPMLVCVACGVLRQDVPLSAEELALWYSTEYLAKAYRHTYEHDLAVAKTRLQQYRLSAGTKLLDVGCGNGAFVTAAREQGIEAWGQDLSKNAESPYVYVGALEDVAFPTDSFDVITVHDVLEHVVDPLAMLRELRRLLRHPGKLIIDFPHFHVDEGLHHWKSIEHLWMLTVPQLTHLLHRAGFRLGRMYRPIPSKIVIEVEKKPEVRPQILVPPGIGDSLWSMVKLPGFLKQRDLTLPDVWVQDAGGPRRTQPFLRTLPMVNAPGYKVLSSDSHVFDEAYRRDGRTLFHGVAGTDYFLAYNGVLGAGRRLEDVDPEYGVDWFPKMHVSKEALAFRDMLAGPGPYLLTYFAEAGFYRRWLQAFPPASIVEALEMVEQDSGLRIVMMGAPWDRGQVGREIVRAREGWVDLIGTTTFDQMQGAILGARAVFGFPAGNTMLATVLRRPTVLMWNSYFPRTFWDATVAPGTPYRALDTATSCPISVYRALRSVLEEADA